MPSGGCFCGKARLTYTGDIAVKALCHCVDCRKITGSTYSTNIIVPEEGFSTTGTLKTISKTADGGNKITSYFCPDCGTTLYRDGPSFKGSKVVKEGIMDDPNALGATKPTVELYTPERVSWVAGIEGSDEKKAMS